MLHIDEGSLRKRFDNLKAILPANLASKRGLNEITDDIRHHTRKLDHIGQLYPKLWKVVRETLEARGAHVDGLPCYQRRPVPLQSGVFNALLEDEQVALALLSSGEGLAHLTALLPQGETTKLQELVVVVPSQRVAESAHSLGWQRVLVAANATDEAMVEAARAWFAAEGNSE